MARLSLFALALALLAAFASAEVSKTAPRLLARRKLSQDPIRTISNGIADTFGTGAVVAGEAVATVGEAVASVGEAAINIDPVYFYGGEAVVGEAAKRLRSKRRRDH